MNTTLLFILLEITLIEILALAILYIIYSKNKARDLTNKQEKPKFKSISITEQGIKQTKQDNKGKLPSPKNLKHLGWHQWFVVLIYILVIGFLGYIAMANLAPESTPGTQSGSYEIESSGIIPYSSELRSFYIDKDDTLGKKAGTKENTYRAISTEEPFNLVLKPRKIIAPDTRAELEIDFQNFGTELYINENLAIPDLTHYTKVQTFSDEGTTVWVKDSIKKPSYKISESNTNSAKDYIYKNYPNTDYYSFKELEQGIPVISDYKRTNTKIDTTFRGGLKLAVYAEKNLEIDFIKQDTNSYTGKDEYTVKVTNLQGKEIHEETFGDDGIKKDTREKGKEQDFNLELKGIKRNIYYIEFIPDDKNKAFDSTLKDIKVNTNKLLITGKALPIESFDFFLKVNEKDTIEFKYWWSNKQQKIKQTGTERDTIDLDEDWKNKKYEQDLEKGNYNFEINKGMVWVYSDFISPEEENWFNLPKEGKNKLIDSDIIVTNNDFINFNENTKEGSYTKDIELNNDKKETKIKLQVLDKDKIYIKSFKLNLKN